MRRDITGGKRGDGHRLQRQQRRIRRPDPRRIRVGKPDPTLTSAGGLLPFGAFPRDIGVDARLQRLIEHLKTGDGVVYPMASQMRLRIDANVLGESCVFGLESLAADPLFVMMAGGTVPSIDTLYRDLDRFGPMEIESLEEMMGAHDLWKKDLQKLDLVHLDIHTTVKVFFGHQGGALPGRNSRYHGRPSDHPILARIAGTCTDVGAQLRPGDTSFGEADVLSVRRIVKRVRSVLRDEQKLRIRIDGAGDCTAVMAAMEDENATFITKADLTPQPPQRRLPRAQLAHRRARRREPPDATGRKHPLRAQGVGEGRPKLPRDRGPPARDHQRQAGLPVERAGLHRESLHHRRVEHRRRRTGPRLRGPRRCRTRHRRAEARPRIGLVPTGSFDANHAMLLLKLLTANLVRRFLRERAPALWAWRIPWLRRAVFRVPGKLVRRGRSRWLRLLPDSFLVRMRN